VQVVGAAPLYVFRGKKTRLCNQVFDRTEKLAVKMGNIIKKM
jgi:hypothetical protein